MLLLLLERALSLSSAALEIVGTTSMIDLFGFGYGIEESRLVGSIEEQSGFEENASDTAKELLAKIEIDQPEETSGR